MNEENVILVDKLDQPIGTMEKIEAHKKGLLHRAFSIFVFNTKGQLLIQKRDSKKYHSPNLWTNTCCSHQREGETTHAAGHRRLIEEMGFNCELTEIFSFTYNVGFSNGLFEHELDHVLFGFFEGHVLPNPSEVCDYKYISKDKLLLEIEQNPDNFTEWFKICLDRVVSKWPIGCTIPKNY